VDAGFSQDVLEVLPHGVHTQVQLARNVAGPRRIQQEPHDASFAGGQAMDDGGHILRDGNFGSRSAPSRATPLVTCDAEPTRSRSIAEDNNTRA
jgi:hypothetical protein